MNIQNKTFIVSGAASGLGRASAGLLNAMGGKVVLLDVDAARGSRAQKELGAAAYFMQTDVTDENAVRNAILEGTDRFGPIYGVVNCAGIGPAERILGREGIHSLDSFRKTIEINLTGTFNLMRLTADAMQHNPPLEDGERGVVVNTASIAAFEGQIGQAAYSASKGGIAAMTLPAARELARFGIRVMCIAPGIFKTAMLEGLPEEVQQSLGAQIPFPSRLGKPEEYAELVKHIIENPMLNGSVIRLDGAIRMEPK